ncbi:hypothetical protein ACR8FC_22490, partial [Salmonella enterica subsp. enterica serovar Paratyphi A]
NLDPESLKVGDGSDGLPVWIGVDAEAQRVYKVYASGLARGFGDGRMVIINGLQAGCGWRAAKAEQSTRGRYISLMGEEGGAVFEVDASPTFMASTCLHLRESSPAPEVSSLSQQLPAPSPISPQTPPEIALPEGPSSQRPAKAGQSLNIPLSTLVALSSLPPVSEIAQALAPSQSA